MFRGNFGILDLRGRLGIKEIFRGKFGILGLRGRLGIKEITEGSMRIESRRNELCKKKAAQRIRTEGMEGDWQNLCLTPTMTRFYHAFSLVSLPNVELKAKFLDTRLACQLPRRFVPSTQITIWG
ncbi:hypothetical protein VNO77_42385 [Canavalia gladiata]|uniref:Uncharacterized protein n=1 Tax=Canavalia gladiata TaxID=3824 RepID=A0AAN9K275_CANGL